MNKYDFNPTTASKMFTVTQWHLYFIAIFNDPYYGTILWKSMF